MQSDSCSAPYDFNMANMCCLPKKPGQNLACGAAVYTCEQTRPLSLVNTDNRLPAGAYRLAVEPILAPTVSAAQRGFLRGRSMNANILDMELLSLSDALRQPRAAMIFYDFKAASPSVNHQYIWADL